MRKARRLMFHAKLKFSNFCYQIVHCALGARRQIDWIKVNLMMRTILYQMLTLPNEDRNTTHTFQQQQKIINSVYSFIKNNKFSYSTNKRCTNKNMLNIFFSIKFNVPGC